MSLNILKKKSYIGLDIGHSTINIVQIDKAGSGWKITKSVSAPIPDETIKEGVVVDADALGLTIKAAVREGKISATYAVIGVAGPNVVVRQVRIPKMTEQVLRKSMKFEAGRYVPTSAEDSYIEAEILDETEDGQMDVLFATAPKEMVDTRIEACKRAGLDVDCVDVEAFAMFRSLIETDDTSILRDMTVALVDIGSVTTSVSVVSRGRFAMTRTIPQAGQTWTDALKGYFKLEQEDAEAGKAQLDLTPLTTDAILDNQPLRVLQPHVDDLIREIRRSLNYYQSQQNESGNPNPVTHLVVSGGGAKLNGLGTYLSHKLGVEVICSGALDNPNVTYAGGEDLGQGQDIAVATGLAMRAQVKAA